MRGGMILKGRPRRRKYSCLLKDPDAKIIGSINTANVEYITKIPNRQGKRKK
jgi:hypothetical protein